MGNEIRGQGRKASKIFLENYCQIQNKTLRKNFMVTMRSDTQLHFLRVSITERREA